MPLPATGELLGQRYRLERALGHGGMGIVWAATDTQTARAVAIKLLRAPGSSDPDLRRRLLREARAARAIKHSNVVDIVDVLELDGGEPAIVMELLTGETLGARLDRDGRIGVEEITTILEPIAEAVDAGHKLGIVHRDLKPENIFLSHDPLVPHFPFPKVLDFGVAKLTAAEGIAARSDGQSTIQGAMLGTPIYMSPEQLNGEPPLDHRTDIWSLGVIFFHSLSGRFPVEARGLGAFSLAITTGTLTPLRTYAPAVPENVASVVMRMLSPRRVDRPPLKEIMTILLGYSATYG